MIDDYRKYSSLRITGTLYDRKRLIARVKDSNHPLFEKDIEAGRVTLAWLANDPEMKLHTSGTTGKPREWVVHKDAMVRHARMTGNALNLKTGDRTLLCLPAQFVAGTMMIVRAFVLGLDLWPGKPVADPSNYLDREFDFSAMTPMQVARVLEKPDGRKRIQKINKLIIGGGPLLQVLEENLRPLKNLIWHTYGMTETLTHIALRRVNGPEASAWFRPLTGIRVTPGKDNNLIVNAPDILAESVRTNDVAGFRDDGTFRIIGRSDHVINSGGLKIYPEMVEEQLAPWLDFPFFIAGWPDEALGEKLIMVVEQDYRNRINLQNLHLAKAAFENRNRFPRAVALVPEIFRNIGDKIRRQETIAHYLKNPGLIQWIGL